MNTDTLLEYPEMIKIMFQYNSVSDYKNILLINKLCYEVIRDPQYENAKMHAFSTMVLRHPELNWKLDRIMVGVTMDIILKYMDRVSDEDTWRSISRNYHLTEDFIIKNENHILWNDVLKNKCVSVEFIRKYEHSRYHMDAISLNPNIDINYIREFKDDLNWCPLSINPAICPYIDEFKDLIQWDQIGLNRGLTEEIVIKYKERMRQYIFFCCKGVSEAFIREHLDDLGDNWRWIAHNPNLSDAFIREFADKLDWKVIAATFKLTPAMLRDFGNKIHPSILCYNKHNSLAFLEKNIAKFKGILYE